MKRDLGVVLQLFLASARLQKKRATLTIASLAAGAALAHAYLGEIKIVQAEVAQVPRHQVFENRLAKALAEEDFIPHEDVRRPEFFS